MRWSMISSCRSQNGYGEKGVEIIGGIAAGPIVRDISYVTSYVDEIPRSQPPAY